MDDRAKRIEELQSRKNAVTDEVFKDFCDRIHIKDIRYVTCITLCAVILQHPVMTSCILIAIMFCSLISRNTIAVRDYIIYSMFYSMLSQEDHSKDKTQKRPYPNFFFFFF